MSSTTPPGSGTVTVPELCAALERMEADAALVAGALKNRESFDLGAVHPDVAAQIATRSLAIADRLTAAGTVTAGHVATVAGYATGTLIAGRFASPRRWLEVDAGLAPHSAQTVLARGGDLHDHSEPVRRAWLAGEISGDAVRELTSGVTGVLKRVKAPREQKSALRADAIDVLMPVAQLGTPADLRKAVSRLRLLADSAGEAAAVVEAYDDQSLAFADVGALTRIEAWLTKENAAAFLTLVGRYAQRVVERSSDVVHDPTCPLASPPAAGSSQRRWCDCGASQAAGLSGKDRWGHAMAVGLGEMSHEALSRADLGSHHGAAPHVTVIATVAEVAASLGGDLVMPGSDQGTVIGSDTVRRIMCDADITPVIVRELEHRPAADEEHSREDRISRLSRMLMNTAVAVLYVGRSKRTVTPAQRRALEVRDRHCIFPGCHAHPRRCHAHHVREWENHGGTDLDNLALLCVRHHISVHEGGWTITPTPGVAPNETGYWTFTPPPERQP